MNSSDYANSADLEREIQEIKTENKRLKTFSEIGKTLFTERNIEKLLPLVMGEISECLDADRSTLFLVDWEDMELWTKFGEGLEVDRISIGMRMGLVGVCVLKRQLVNVANAYEDPFFNAKIDEVTGYRTESVLCAPFSNEAGEVMGALQLLNSKTGKFTDENEQKGVLKILHDKGIDTSEWEDGGKQFAQLFIAAKPDHFPELLEKMKETRSMCVGDESERITYIVR